MKDINKVGWRFSDNNGEFIINDPHKTSYLYFPLANEAGMMSSISPTLGGDIKTGQNTFLMTPVSPEDLHNSRASRNFWIRLDEDVIWSASGNSPWQHAETFSVGTEQVELQCGFLWHKVMRKNIPLGIMSEIINFVPSNGDKVELMKVTLTNIGDKNIKIKPTAAIPIYGRSADNIRDHRHVTSLLNRILTTEYGVIVNPTLTFDERGHKPNTIFYSVQAADDTGAAPKGFFPLVEEFIGEGGSLEWPEVVVSNSDDFFKAGFMISGYEAMGAIRFDDIILKPGESKSYIIAMGISEDNDSIEKYRLKYCNLQSFDQQLDANKKYWSNKLNVLSFKSADKDFDSWMKWIELQPMLRRIYGCSFLPHHDYGRGGRGWRDLWQDCLALLIMDPEPVRELLFNNYAGVRIDGSNATIIGNRPGEFIADRNNISRIWMDHGAWPYITTRLYIDQSGDMEFLLGEQVYFKDKLCSRSKTVDSHWDENYGNRLKDTKGNIYKGSILEHILIEQLSCFYNVGTHNNIKLEGADWNDGLDMAADKGESVAFTAFYGSNLLDLSNLLLKLKERLSIKEVDLASEMIILLDSISEKIDYNSVEDKNKLLQKYFNTCSHEISGNKIKIDIEALAKDLKGKALWIKEHIKHCEWIRNSEGFEWFNGYYDNQGERLEGEFSSGVRMTLTGQVYAIMGGFADKYQIESIIRSVNRYLIDDKIGGPRLNTNFEEIKLDMGRCFGFAFGHKENGAMFSHMSVMYVNALYRQGFAKEGYSILSGIFDHCKDFEKSRIYPGIPEYINEKGRGMYQYLTGAASWLLLTMVNEVFGVRGDLGDLILEPKLMSEQFDEIGKAEVYTVFKGKKLKITYENKEKLQYGKYEIKKLVLDGDTIEAVNQGARLIIDRDIIDLLAEDRIHDIQVELRQKGGGGYENR